MAKGQVKSTRFHEAETGTNPSAVKTLSEVKFTAYAIGRTTAAAGSATIEVEARPAGTGDNGWVSLGTITLTLATTDSADAFAVDSPYQELRFRVTAISGTGANVDTYIMSEAE